MRSMCSAQRQVERRRLGNQLPLLGKANLLCKIVKKMLCDLPLRLNDAATRYDSFVRSIAIALYIGKS